MTTETMRPTLRQMTIFDAAVAQGSVGAAARRLGLSQPAVSHALAKLEAVIGTPLLTRGQGGSVASTAGTILHRRVARMQQQIREGIGAAAGGAYEATRLANLATALTSTQVRTHVAIAEHGAFRDAAAALGISPPALHRTAHELERLV
ncbi:MAG: LysR family transcriptional regulator, partial [Sphingomonas sp.]